MGDMKKREIENIVGGSSHGGGEGGGNKIRKIDQGQEGLFQEGRSFHPNTDPKKLKEMIANRKYSQRYQQKKAQYVVGLEMQVKDLQTRIGFLHSQIEAFENNKLSLLIEQQTMKVQIVAGEKERLLQEVEIEKNRAEVNKLNELLMVQVDALTKIKRHNSNAARFNLNLLPSSSNEEQDGEE